MKKILIIYLIISFLSCKSDKKDKTQATSTTLSEMPLKLTPIEHATFVMEWEDEVVYVDPTGGKESFEGTPEPTLILITDIHGDHFDLETLNQLSPKAHLVAPEAVYAKMPVDIQKRTKLVGNGQDISFHGFNIAAIPMYNISQDRLKYHVKGRGNGYVLTREEFSVYISGDTEDIPEMRNLKDINLALVCMNLPYTMTPEAAADATLDFKPNVVIPYHYRGMKNKERHYFDVNMFKEIVVTGNSDIQVELLDWYPEKS
jgi:L-ascorbate metabolism protein UlaG (beta-lactamase superfamily)